MHVRGVPGLSVVHRAGRRPCWSTGAWVGAGWVYRVGNTGTYPATALSPTGTLTAKRAPEAPARGLEWVVRVGWATPSRDPVSRYPGTSGDHPVPGPGRSPCRGPPCHLLEQKVTFDLIPYKVSQNREVSTKSVEKACHGPYSQNAVQMSPLDFLGFPYSVAFSPKELMGRFDPYTHVYCQNDEVSPDVHGYM